MLWLMECRCLCFISSILMIYANFFSLFLMPIDTLFCFYSVLFELFLEIKPYTSFCGYSSLFSCFISLKRGSMLWNAGDSFSLTLMIRVFLFLRMASNLGLTIGKAMLYWPGPSDDLLDSSGSSRAIFDLKTEDEAF